MERRPMMKLIIVVLIASFFISCSSTTSLEHVILPELQEQQPLPPYPKPTGIARMKIDFEFLVHEDGSVSHVKLLSSSGVPEWDSSARESVSLWKYSPALYQGKAVRLWLRQTAVIQFSAPINILLTTISCSTKYDADSLYELYRQDFAMFSADLNANNLKKDIVVSTAIVNINLLPPPIKAAIEKLKRDEFTQPFLWNERYVIFMKRDPGGETS